MSLVRGVYRGVRRGLARGVGKPAPFGLTYPASQSDLQAMTGFGGTADHLWRFSRSSGIEPDLIGAEDMEAVGSPTRGLNDPKLGASAQGTDGSTSRLRLSSLSAAAVAVTVTNSVAWLFTLRFPSAPSVSNRSVIATGGDSAQLEVRTRTDGTLRVNLSDGTNFAQNSISAAGLYTGSVIVGAAVIDRSVQTMQLFTNLADSSSVSIATVGDCTGTSPLSLLSSPAGTARGTNAIVSFLAVYQGAQAESFAVSASAYRAAFQQAVGL